jgi:transposase
MCWAPGSAVWWPRSLPIRTGWAALGVTRFVRFAANRGLRVRRSAADRLVAAARAALPSTEAQVARQVLADDLVLLACLDAQIAAAEAKIAKLLPETPFAPLTTVPGWGTIRASNYGAAVGDLDRWPGARQLYRACGLSPAQYESAGKRRDGGISREGSVALRRALIDLGIGLWHADPAARRYGQLLRARGKKGGVIGCAMANRANRIAYALVRDQCGYDPNRWA